VLSFRDKKVVSVFVHFFVRRFRPLIYRAVLAETDIYVSRYDGANWSAPQW
jgi:hypothetical protein